MIVARVPTSQPQGVDIPTLAVGGGTTNIRGTSAAAAEVAGAAALLLATGAAPSDIARRLSTTAQPTDVDGIGILDLAAALGGGAEGAEPLGDTSGPTSSPYYVAEPTPTPTPTPTPAPTPTPTPWPTPAGIQGLDVSHWNDVPDFADLKQLGTRFVFSKATQGTSFIDWTYLQHTADARAAGVHAGAYHFFDYRVDGTKQARHFLATVRGTSGLTGLLPLVIDVEYLQGLGTPNKAAARVRLRDMVNEIYRQTGRYPMIYTSQNMWERVVGAPADFGDHPLWVACWKCDRIYMPRGWTTWTFWQFGQITFDGGPNLDGNVYSSDLRSLNLERQRPMRLDQGATWSGSRTVQADLIGYDGKDVRYAVGDQAFGAWQPYQPRFSLQLGPQQGEQDVRIQLRNSKNVKSPILRDDIRLDTKRPSLSGPRIIIRGGARMERSAARVPIRATVKAKDARSGLKSVSLRARCAGIKRASRSGPGPVLTTATSLNRSGCTIVNVAKDAAGNTARNALSPRFGVIDLRASQGGVRFSGKWKVARAKAALGRTLARTSVRGAQARVAFRGEQFAVVVRRGSSGGRLAVIVDGKRVDTIDLYAPKADQRRIAYVRNVGRGRHVLKLRATGTGDARSAGSTVWLDSVLVLDRRQ